MELLEDSELMAPVSDAHPCGPELFGTPEMAAFEDAISPPAARMFGDAETDTRNWPKLRDQAVALLKNSKDLRLTQHLTVALLHTDGVAGLAASLRLIGGYLEVFWQQLYPELDVDDDDDPTMRMNCLRELFSPTVLQFLRDYPLVKTRIGRFSVRDVQLTTGEIKSEEEGPPITELRAAFQMAQSEARQLRSQVQSAIDSANHIGKVFHACSGMTLQLTPLIKTLTSMAKAIDNMCPESPTEVAQGGAEDAGFAANSEASMNQHQAVGQAAGGAPGRIQTRQDVVVALKLICEYYERQEPSSPIPLLLKRAERLVEMNFKELLQDLADQGLSQLAVISGEKDEDDDD